MYIIDEVCEKSRMHDVTVYTAITNDFDPPREDILCFGKNYYVDDHTARKVAKIYKILPHIFLSSTWTIWTDGNIFLQRPAEDFVEIVEKSGKEIGVFEHPQRTNVYDEACHCIKKEKGDKEEIEAQIEKYAQTQTLRLPRCDLIIRKNTSKIRRLCELWWQEICNHSIRDQLSFDFIFGNAATYLPKIEAGEFLKRERHVYKIKKCSEYETTRQPIKTKQSRKIRRRAHKKPKQFKSARREGLANYLRTHPHPGGIIVCTSPKFIYMKPAKTAGTSILRHVLQKYFSYLFHYKDHPEQFLHWIEQITDQELEEYFIFGVVRNPFDRIVSTATYLGISFESFIHNFELFYQEDRIKAHSLPLVYYTHLNNYPFVDHICRFEKLQSEIQPIFNKIGLEEQKLPHLNVSKRSHYSYYYSPEEIELVYSIYWRDIKYFGYQFGK